MEGDLDDRTMRHNCCNEVRGRIEVGRFVVYKRQFWRRLAFAFGSWNSTSGDAVLKFMNSISMAYEAKVPS